MPGAGRPRPVRRAPGHVGRVLRIQVTPRDAVPSGYRGGARGPAPHGPGGHPRPPLRRRRLRLPRAARDRGGPYRDGEGAGGRLGGRAVRPPSGRTGLLLVRHRRGGPRLRARHRHARGRRAHLLRSACARARARRAPARRSRYLGGLAPPPRPRPDHRTAPGQFHFRGRQPTSAAQMRAGLALVALAALLGPGLAVAAPAPVAKIDIEGVISPVTLRLVGLALDRAQSERAQALVIQLDTPGGLERSMRAIVQRMLGAEVPVIIFVAPTGARAASAGVFITLAAHVAAMAPATNIGAASPVMLGGGNVDKTMMKKIENDAAAFIRTVALERGRNADWAEKAVRQAVSITEREAVRLRVVDLVADSMPDLLQKIDGRTVKTPRGTVRPRTRGAPLKGIETGFPEPGPHAITHPNHPYA